MRRVLFLLLAALPLAAQQSMPEHDMSGMQMSSFSAGSSEPMMASGGTAFQPASTPMAMIHRRSGKWMFMFHGVLFGAGIQQTGPRGADKLVGMGWVMGEGTHPLGDGFLTLRAMLSPDPLLITQRVYPLLFQTGETAYGNPIVDGQHPHNFVMELGAEYKWRFSSQGSLVLYAAPVGDPALGPVAFPHRESASEIPQATITHHLQDSTHISYEVVTAAVSLSRFTIEGSGFHGGEPNENRWNIGHGAVDSWSTRLSFRPTRNWTTQISGGRLAHPEALEPGDQTRLTASASYTRVFSGGDWANTFVWGRVHKTGSGANLNGWLAESMLRFRRANYVSGRLEVADKDELFAESNPLSRNIWRVAAYTAGYTRDIPIFPRVATGLGLNVTTYTLPAAIQPAYGAHPAAVVVFVRFRLKEG